MIRSYRGGEVCLEVGRERDRDRELTALFLSHYDPLRRLAYVILGDATAAEEVVMDAFAKAMSKWGLFSRADHPAAYMRQIVVNLCRSKIRRKVLERRVGETFERKEDAISSQDVEAEGTNSYIWNAVRKLPHRQRACIVLRYLEDMTEPEIAEVLNVPVGTVKSQLSRGRAKLATWLGEDVLEETS